MIDFCAPTAVLRGLSGPERPILGTAYGSRPSTQQGSPRQIPIGQTGQQKHLRGVLSDLHVAHLCVAKLTLNTEKYVLDMRASRGHPVSKALVRFGQRVPLPGLEQDTSEYAGAPGQALERVVHVTFFAEHRAGILAHQVRQLVDVRDVGGHHRNNMHASGIEVGACADLHAEAPLVDLLGLMHLGVGVE